MKEEIIYMLDETVSILDNTKSILAPTRKEEIKIFDIPLSSTTTPLSSTETKDKKKKVIWVPDADRQECNLCKTSFGFFTRQHHCRTCGEIFCDNCSQFRDAVGDRLCKRCKANPPNTYARPPN